MRSKFKEFEKMLASGDQKVCGHAPKWICEAVRERVLELLSISDEVEFEKAASTFEVGAARFIADSCRDDCDVLLESLPACDLSG